MGVKLLVLLVGLLYVCGLSNGLQIQFRYLNSKFVSKKTVCNFNSTVLDYLYQTKLRVGNSSKY